MAERTVFTDSGYRPGRALSPEEYSGGFVDFYKDYLGSTGVKVDKPKDDDDDDKKDTTTPNILGTDDGGDDEGINLLSSVFSSNNLSGGETYYDAKVDTVDLQSMDLSHGSWANYKKATQTSDKSLFGKDTQIGVGSLGFGGVPVALAAGAVLGDPVTTPWGTENHGGGIVKPIGDYAASLKYDALVEMKALDGMFDMADDPESMGVGSITSTDIDKGDVIKINGELIIRPRGTTNLIGTLPTGLSKQKALNLMAINNGFLPSYTGGQGTETGFGVGGLGGYTKEGYFSDANGQRSAFGSDKALTQLAKVEFGGNRDAAEKWLQEVRKGRTLFSSTMTMEKAQAIKNRIQQEFGVSTTSSTGKVVNPTNKYGSSTMTDDQLKNQLTSYTTGYELDGIYRGPGSPVGIEAFGDLGDPVVTTPATADVTVTDRFRSGVNITQGGDLGDSGVSLAVPTVGRRSTIGSIAQPGVRFTTGDAIAGRKKGKPLFADTRTQTPTSIFRDLTENRGFTFKQATDVLNTIIPQTGLKRDTFLDAVVPATFETTDDSGDDTTFDDQVQAEADMGLDPFGGAGEPVNTSGGESSSSDDKIVCTMMNQSYGFGSFRNAIWLKYSKDNLSEEYQKGYHRIFLPLVAYAKGNKTSNKIVRNILEHIARHRTLDLKQEMRGKKRHTLGRLYRSILEPMCYMVGKI